MSGALPPPPLNAPRGSKRWIFYQSLNGHREGPGTLTPSPALPPRRAPCFPPDTTWGREARLCSGTSSQCLPGCVRQRNVSAVNYKPKGSITLSPDGTSLNMSNWARVAFAARGWILLPRGGEAPGGPGGRLLWSTPRKCCHRHSRLTVPTRPAFLLLLGTHLSPTMTPFSSCPRLRPCRWHLSWVGFPGSRAWPLIYQGRAVRETETGVGQQAWAGSRTAVGAVRPPPRHTHPPTHTPPHTHRTGANGAQSRGLRPRHLR